MRTLKGKSGLGAIVRIYRRTPSPRLAAPDKGAVQRESSTAGTMEGVAEQLAGRLRRLVYSAVLYANSRQRGWGVRGVQDRGGG